jgi:hypothetical protein
MKNMVWILTYASFCLMVSGCRHQDKNPQLKDPIYNQIVKDSDAIISQIAAAKVEVEKSKANYDSAPIRTGQQQDAADDYFESKNRLEKLIEHLRYLSLAGEHRIKEDHEEYAKAFEKAEPWPNPQAYSDFLIDQKLQNAPKEWSAEERIKQRHPAATKPAAEEGHEE